MEVAFVKVPVYVSDSTNEHHLFDLLLPKKCNEQSILTVISLLTRFRHVMNNQKSLNNIIAEFYDSQPYQTFNFLFIKEIDEIITSQEGFKKIRINDKVCSLNNQEQSDLFFSTVICINIMNIYKSE